MRSRRGMVVALAVTAFGAVLVLATAGQSRWSIGGAAVSGGAAPGATALGLVAVAGLGLVLLLAGRARSVVGVLLVLTGVVIVLVDVHSGGGGWSAYSPIGQNRLQPHRSVWFWLTAVGGVLVGAGGLLVTIWGHRWPGARRDYRARAEPSPVRRDAWSALDRGEDPTL